MRAQPFFEPSVWTRPSQPLSLKDHGTSIFFGDGDDRGERRANRAGKEQIGIRRLKTQSGLAFASPGTCYQGSPRTSVRSEDDFEHLLAGEFQDLQERLMTQHRSTLDSLHASLDAENRTLRDELETARASTSKESQRRSQARESQRQKLSTRSTVSFKEDIEEVVDITDGACKGVSAWDMSAHSSVCHLGNVGERLQADMKAAKEALEVKATTQSTIGGMFNFRIRQEWIGLMNEIHGVLLQDIEHTTSGDLSRGKTKAVTQTAGLLSMRKSRVTGIMGSGVGVMYRRRDCLIHPKSKFSFVLNLVSMALLVYDAITVPIDVCFEIKHSEVIEWVHFLARLYWTMDIGRSFATGVVQDGEVEMDSRIVAYVYLKTWFFFDIFVVGFEWLMVAITSLASASFVSLMRTFRWFRLLRILRLLRIMRLAKVRSLINEMIVLSSEDLEATKRLVNASMYLLVFSHLAACIWHLVGDLLSDGWVVANELQNNDVAYRYLVSLHWVIRMLLGSSSTVIVADKRAELAVDIVVLVVALVLSSYFTAVMTQTVISWSISNTTQMHKIATNFIQRHRISKSSTHKTMKYLQANRVQGPGEVVMEEARLVRILPVHLQVDLLYEARVPVLGANTVFQNLHCVSDRTVSHLCHEAITDLLVVEDEIVFGPGDLCSRMFMVRSGRFKYWCDEEILAKTPRTEQSPRDAASSAGSDILHRFQIISEAVLWTSWVHMGDLQAMDDSLLYCMETDKFTSVILQHKMASAFAVKYARHFTWHLNRSPYCDLVGFDFSLYTLDQSFGAGHDHFIFISHYKIEAGTEATLMRDLLESMIKQDASNEASYLRSPIFIDSEELTDLTKLKQHVEGSNNLVVLLTPDVLARPWCLLELVTAVRVNAQLVPVEVQRPGMKYRYPDEDFYRKLRMGQVVSHKDILLLEQEGCSIEDVEDAIHQLFMKIALPFSPHKSGNVRQAELADILKRCQSGAQPVHAAAPVEGTPGHRRSVGSTSSEQQWGSLFSMALPS